MLDLDGFEGVNDRLGHSAADTGPLLRGRWKSSLPRRRVMSRFTRRTCETATQALATCLWIVASFAVFGAASALVAQSAQALGAGHVHVTFTDTAGAPLRGPLFDSLVVWPKMTPLLTEFGVMNDGAGTARYTIQFSRRNPAQSPDLADRLVVHFRADDTDDIVYAGSLDSVRIESVPELRPGASARYTVTTTWPSLPDDDLFQGRTTDFDLVLRASGA